MTAKIIAERKDKTIYKDGEKIIKVFDPEYSKANVLNEALNQARVEETGLKIPKLLEVSTVDGKWSITTEYIKGKTMAQLMEENPDKTEEYLERLVDIQLEIHSKKAPLLNKLKDKMDRKINEADLTATQKYELHARLAGMPKHDKVCHGDFNPSNIIIREDGSAYIIDWAHATRGNASADAARTYLLFSIDKKESLAEKYINLFAEKSGIEKSHIQRWIPIVAATQMTKNNPEEQEFLSKWINVMDYE